MAAALGMEAAQRSAAADGEAWESMEHLAAPPDAMRAGLPFLKADIRDAHAAQALEKKAHAATAGERATHQRRAYGVAMPAREAIERQILGKIGASQRLPGLPASFLGLQALTGELDALPHGSVFNNQEGRIASFFNETEVAPALGQPRDGAGGALVGGLHAEMEKRLGM